MFHREGSGALTLCYVACGRLIGYVEPHINSWDCLGALAIVQAAGGRINDFLFDDGLWKGNRVIAGPAALYPTLESLFGSHHGNAPQLHAHQDLLASTHRYPRVILIPPHPL